MLSLPNLTDMNPTWRHAATTAGHKYLALLGMLLGGDVELVLTLPSRYITQSSTLST